MTLAFLAIAVGSYLIGSFSMGLAVARIRSVDLRKSGSGNIGATNAARTMGRGVGLLTLASDALKPVVAMALALRFADLPDRGVVLFVSGLAAFLGHLFPVYHRFRGGKGVATAAGIGFFIAPLPTLVALAVFVAVVVTTRYVSAASIAAAVALAGVSLLVVSSPLNILPLIIASAVIAKHRDNIARLRSGDEPRFPR